MSLRVVKYWLQGIILVVDGDEHEFEIEPFSKYCLINGLDQLSFILNHEDDIRKYEGTL